MQKCMHMAWQYLRSLCCQQDSVVHGGIRPKAIEIQETNILQVKGYDHLKLNSAQIYTFKAFMFPFSFRLANTSFK